MPEPDQPNPGTDPDEIPSGEPPAESIVTRFEPLSWTAEAAARAKTGDREALGELYRRHYERVRRCAAMSMGKTLRRCEADIEDVVHEAFVEAFDRLLAGQFDETRSAGGFRSWLSMICVNKVRGRGRARKRGKGAELSLDAGTPDSRNDHMVPPGTGPGPATQVEQADLNEKVEEAILSLNERDRTVILLRHICGMTGEEVAEEMGFKSPAQVRWVLFRALERLRGKLEKHAPDLPRARTEDSEANAAEGPASVAEPQSYFDSLG